MLELDDLVDLGEELRRRDFRVAPDQLLSAQIVLQALQGETIANSRAELISYLGPIFCTSATDQRRFPDIYGAWVKRRFHETLSLPGQPAAKPTVQMVGGRRSLPWRPLAALLSVMLMLIGGLAAWQHWRPREVIGTVVSNQGVPIEGAVITFGIEKTTTSATGTFHLTLTASELPIEFNVSKTNYEVGLVGLPAIGADLQSRRKWLYLGASLSKAPIILPAISLTPVPPPTFEETVNIEFPPETPRPALAATLEQSIDLTTSVPPPGLFQRLILNDAALTVAPLLAFLLLQLWRALRRPVLQRFGSKTPPKLRDVHLPGGISALTPGLPMRRLAQELRRRRLRHSPEVRADATIAATLRNGGIFTPVFGSRVEPDYLVLVDAASMSDHQARLADELIHELTNCDVLIERYSFHDVPAVCEPAEPTLGSASASKRDASVELTELQARYPEHRLLLFTDGSGLFDPFTGAPSECVETLLGWESVFILTSRPEKLWSNVEWALESLGFKVLPLNRAGLLALMNLLSGAPDRAGMRSAKKVPLSLHDRSPQRWLEREQPDQADITRLCNEVEKDLGPRGFAWLAACAAYPEIHWGITLRLGAVLVPDRAQLEALLPSLARLVWLREAYMPDWLRTELLNRLQPRDETIVRSTLHEILGSLSGQPGAEVPLRIASEPVPTHRLRAFVQRVRTRFARWRKRQRAEAIIASTPEASPLRDYVFLRFLYGHSLGKLAISAPGALMRILFRGGSPLLGFRSGIALSAALAVSCVIGVAVGPFHDGKYVIAPTLAHFSANGERLALPFTAGFFAVNEGADSEVMTSFGVAMVESGEVSRTIVLPGAGKDTLRLGLAMSDDLTRLAFLEQREGSPDRAIVWDLTAGQSIAQSEVQGCTSDFGRSCIEFSPDGSKVAFAVNDTTVDIVDIESGQKISVSDGKTNVLGFAFDGTGRFLATSAPNGVAVSDARTGQRLAAMSDASNEGIGSVAFGPDGDTLFWATREGVIAWDRVTARRVKDLSANGASIAAMALQRSGRLLSILHEAKPGAEVTLLDTTNGASFSGISVGDIEYLRMAFSPDGRRLGIAMVDSDGLNSRVEVWRAPEGNAAPAASRSFALVVGNDASTAGIDLANAVRDASSVATVLRERYGFGVTLLQNASTARVRDALRQYANILQPADQLLIYLSGIGSEDGQGAFAFHESQGPGLLTGGEIGQLIRTLRAANVLIVIDAHHGERLQRENPLDMPSGLAELIVASGDSVPPSDGTPGLGSPFAIAFVQSLASGTAARSAERTFLETRSIMSRLPGKEQIPVYAQLSPSTGSRSLFQFPTPRTPALSLPSASPPEATGQSNNTTSPEQTSATATEELVTQDQSQVAQAPIADQPLEVSGDVTIESEGPVVDFSNTVGKPGAPRRVVLRNPRPSSVRIAARELAGTDGIDRVYSIKDSCSNRTLEPGQTCEIVIEFSPNQRIRPDGVLIFTDGYSDLARITLRARINRPNAPSLR